MGECSGNTGKTILILLGDQRKLHRRTTMWAGITPPQGKKAVHTPGTNPPPQKKRKKKERKKSLHHGSAAHSLLAQMYLAQFLHRHWLNSIFFTKIFLRLLSWKPMTHLAWIIPVAMTQFTFLAPSLLFCMSYITWFVIRHQIPLGQALCGLIERFAVKVNVVGLNLSSATCYLQVLAP